MKVTENRNEQAVSPIIGVILMVAITVILAAIIAGFVVGMAGNVQRTYHITTITADQSDQNVDFTVINRDSDLNYLSVIMPNSDKCDGIYNSTGVKGELKEEVWQSSDDKPQVGSVYYLKDCATSGRDRAIVTAHFADGSDQVMLDTKV